MVLPYRVILAGLGYLCLGTVGCTTIHPEPDYQRLQQQVRTATGQSELYIPGIDVSKQIESLLADGITAHEAVQIGLLNNPQLQSAVFDISMGRAEVVQAGLLSNPFIGVGVQFPESGGLVNLTASIAQNIAELWQIPVRARSAGQALEQKILFVAGRATQLAAEIKAAYYRALTEEKRYALAEENRALVHQLAELTRLREEAGAGNNIDVNLARSEEIDGELAIRQAELARFDARRQLAVALGLSLDPDDLHLTDALPDIASIEFTGDIYFRLVQNQRLDLKMTRQAVCTAYWNWQVQRRRIFSNLEIGAGFERGERGRAFDGNIPFSTLKNSIEDGQPALPDIEQNPSDPEFIIGPTLGFELPIFDQNQAQIALAYFAYEQALRLYRAQQVETIQEARLAYKQYEIFTRNLMFYRDQIMPLRETTLQLARESYQAGKTPILPMIEAQRAVLSARASYVDLWCQQASSKINLERIASLPFEQIISKTQSIATTTSQPIETPSGE
ncbi:MAG: hypothetical protein HJJLKODD_00452 [Phycisphaerae bacterium]|nr:hypothetical protein [Phycisphaerae bacterium]